MKRLPAPLAALLALAVVEALAWICLIPALQGPDEVGHFSYTQRVWEGPSIPWHPTGASMPGRPAVSTELNTAGIWAGLEMLAGNRSARPLWTEPDEDIWARADARLDRADRTDGGFTSALKNPPLYYLYTTPAYAIASGTTIFDRLFWMRVANVPLLLAVIGLTWLIAGELLSGRRWLQFTAAALVAVHPQLVNLAATHNPDSLLAAGWALALWLILVVLRRGPEPGVVGALAATCAAVGLTHARGLPIVAPAALAVLIAWRRQRGRSARPVATAAAALVALALAATAAAAWGRGYAREFWSYVWQFYLPRAPGQQDPIGPDWWDFPEAFSDRFYGTLAHLEVVFPAGLLSFLFWGSLAGLAALAVVLVVRRTSLTAAAGPVVALSVAVVALVLFAHLGAYRAMLGEPADPVLTGRYLLPVIPLYGVAVALVADALPRRAGVVFAGLLVGAAGALQLLGGGLLLERFYA